MLMTRGTEELGKTVLVQQSNSLSHVTAILTLILEKYFISVDCIQLVQQRAYGNELSGLKKSEKFVD
jgi:hypothetical protein